MKQPTRYFIVLGCVLTLLAGAVIIGWNYLQNGSAGSGNALNQGVPPQAGWQAQPDQATAQNSAGLFKVTAALITPKELLLFYTLQSSLADGPQAIAILPEASEASPASNQTRVNQIQLLGKLGKFDIGVIHLAWINQPGQSITLKAKPVQAANSIWQVSPLKQLRADLDRTSTEFLSIQTGTSEILVEIGTLGGENNYATLSVSSPNAQSLFLQVDLQMVVSKITEAEFNASKVNASSNSTEPSNPGMATPAPPEP